jgi:hypothetical protein
MAGAGYKLFQTGDVLTAAQVNTYLNEQTVMVFANAAARTSALTSVLAEGMVSYLQDTNAVEVYNGSAWVGVSGAGDVTEVQAGTGISVASGTGPIPVVTNTMATAIDAEGDLIIGDAADAFQRLAIGSNTHVLTVDTSVDGKIKWAAPAGGSSGPAFRAFRNTSAQSVTAATWTKVQLNGETFDTASCFDSTTNYRFTPNVSGYYSLLATILGETQTATTQYTQVAIYKNGSLASRGTAAIAQGDEARAVVNDLIYFNGTTDYVELFGFITAGTVNENFINGTDNTYFSGVWIRS